MQWMAVDTSLWAHIFQRSSYLLSQNMKCSILVIATLLVVGISFVESVLGWIHGPGLMSYHTTEVKLVNGFEKKDDPKSEANEKPMYLDGKDSAKSIESSDVLQQLILRMGNISSTMENLLLLLHKSMPKMFDSVSDSKPAVTGNNRNVAPVVPSNDGSAVTPLTSCAINDDNFEECLKGYVQNAIKYSKGGYSRFSIPPLDPYSFTQKVEMMLPNQDLKIQLTNVRVFGFSEAVITQIHIDPVSGVFDISFVVPLARCQGQYTAIGVFALKSTQRKINSRGEFEVSFTELSHHLTIEGEVRPNENGNKYFHIKSVNLVLDPQRINMRFDNVFGKNKMENDFFNESINENWSTVFEVLQPGIQEKMSETIFKKLISDFFEAVPINEIFPHDSTPSTLRT